MFSIGDFNDFNKDPDSVPDGLIDATEFYEDLVFLSNKLQETDYESMDSKTKTMMEIINYYHNQTTDGSIEVNQDKLYGITIGLLFHIANIFVGMDYEATSEYWEYINNELLPQMKEDKTILPYWSSDES